MHKINSDQPNPKSIATSALLAKSQMAIDTTRALKNASRQIISELHAKRLEKELEIACKDLISDSEVVRERSDQAVLKAKKLAEHFNRLKGSLC